MLAHPIIFTVPQKLGSTEHTPVNECTDTVNTHDYNKYTRGGGGGGGALINMHVINTHEGGTCKHACNKYTQ